MYELFSERFIHLMQSSKLNKRDTKEVMEMEMAKEERQRKRRRGREREREIKRTGVPITSVYLLCKLQDCKLLYQDNLYIKYLSSIYLYRRG